MGADAAASTIGFFDYKRIRNQLELHNDVAEKLLLMVNAAKTKWEC